MWHLTLRPFFQLWWFGSTISYCNVKSLSGLRRLSVFNQTLLILGACSKVRLKYCRLGRGSATSSPFVDVTSSRHDMHMHFRRYFLTDENVCTSSGAFRTRIRLLQGWGVTRQGAFIFLSSNKHGSSGQVLTNQSKQREASRSGGLLALHTQSMQCCITKWVFCEWC